MYSFVGMQIVGHDGFGDRTVVLNQLRTEIQVKNIFTVVEPGERLVDLEDFAALRAERFAAREDSQ